MFLIFFMSALLLSSFALVTSFNTRSTPLSLTYSTGSFLNQNTKGLRITKQRASSDLDSTSVVTGNDDRKFYGFRSIAGEGVPSAKLADPLSLSVSAPSITEVEQNIPITFSPTLTIPSVPNTSAGFSDIPSIASTSSPSFDSTLTFNSEKPKSQAVFTFLNRLNRFKYKLDLVKKLKITTWDSPR